jgi:hypothetical protein
MRQNRFIIALLVFFTGFFILAPQSYTLYRYYVWQGEKLSATHLNSNKTSNSKDTVMMPIYSFTRTIGPIKQECKIPVFERIHALDTQPSSLKLTLKVGGSCSDFVILDDKPLAPALLFLIGFIFFALGLHLMRLAWKTPKGTTT